MNIPESCIYELEAAMEQWSDNRVIHVDDLEDLLLFLLYMPKVFSQSQMRFAGFSCRQKQGQWLLTVKATENSIPLVGFVTASTPTGCVTQFVRLLENDRLHWAKDKYPWN